MAVEEDGAVVLLSGGMDSTSLLHHAVGNLGHGPVHALSLDHGQRHSQRLYDLVRSSDSAYPPWKGYPPC